MLAVVIIALACVSAVSALNSSCPVDWSDSADLKSVLGMTVTCGVDKITVTVPDMCMLTEAGFAVGDLTVNGASGVSEVCPDAASTTTTGGDWTLEFALNECGTTHAPTSTDSTYSNALSLFDWSDLNGAAVFRYAFLTIPFHCTYPLTATASLNEFTVPMSNLVGDQVDETGDFGATVRVCTDIDCVTEIVAGSEVTILDEVYVRITTEHSLTIQIQSLVAGSDDADPPTFSYNLISAYCDEDTAAGSSYLPGATGATTYMFKAFQWTDHTTSIYLKVTYTLCDTGSGNTCSNLCVPARRRRSLAAFLTDQPTETQTLGPWNVVA